MKRNYRLHLSDIKNSIAFKIEKAKLDFIVSLNELLKANNISKTDLAHALDCSAPNISKLLKGDKNLTLETMVKVADAAGGDLHIHIARRNSRVHWLEAISENPMRITSAKCNNASEPLISAWQSHEKNRNLRMAG